MCHLHEFLSQLLQRDIFFIASLLYDMDLSVSYLSPRRAPVSVGSEQVSCIRLGKSRASQSKHAREIVCRGSKQDNGYGTLGFVRDWFWGVVQT